MGKNRGVVMNKKIIVITILSIITGLVILNVANQKEYLVKEIEKQKTHSNMLTMMLETEAESGNYEETTASEWPQDGYIFNESLSRCENGGTLSWDDDAKKVIMKSNSSDKCYVYFDIYEPTLSEICNNMSLADCLVANVYTEDGVNDLYYHDGTGTYTNASEEAGDNSYRYSGTNPNNYVCFGSDAATCPDDNLYRIIGLFDDDQDGTYNIKLIKYDYVTSQMLGTDGRDYAGTYSENTGNYKGNMNTSTIAAYRWNYDTSVSDNGSNDWTTSRLNKTNLNINYINYLDNINSNWVNMIATTTWHLGNLDSGFQTAKESYIGERNNAESSTRPTTYRDEIGLMYPSDYGYAASPENWTTELIYYDNSTNTNNNWMYMGLFEWTITPDSSDSFDVFFLHNDGFLHDIDADHGYAARPVFYLESNIALISGDGSKENPFRLSL